jgi:DNA/RNA-binding domain of Phe-tRNA-synthetase-like protein
VPSIDFRLVPEVLIAFPDLRVSVLRVKGLKAALTSFNATEALNQAAQAVAQNFLTPEELVSDPCIEGWRKAYGAIGVKPSKFRSSIEALARRAIKAAPLTTGIAAVDLYNAVSLETLAPLGAYDAASLPAGTMELRFANPASDSFDPLGGTAADFPLQAKLAVYATGDKILCWGFNCRDSKDTCLTETTDDALFFGEAVFTEHHAALHQALEKLRIILGATGAECGDVHSVNREEPEMAF